MGHPGVAAAVAGSAVCLLVGTRLSVTARAGLDDALARCRSSRSVRRRRTCRAPTSTPTTCAARCRDADGRRCPGMDRPTGTAGARHGCAHRASAADVRRRRRPLPRRDDRARRGAARRRGRRRRRREHRRVGDPLPTGASRRPVRGGARHGRHGLQLRRRGRDVRSARRRRTVVIAGDGSFFMHGMEIHTALQYRLPVTFLLFNNNAHAMCVTREQLFYDDLYSYNRFGPSRLGAGLAAMFPGLLVGRRRRHRRAARRAAGGAGRRRTVGGQHRMLGRRNPAVRTLSRQCRTDATTHHEGERRPMSLPALEDITAHRGHSRSDRRRDPHRDFAPGEGHPDHHGDDAVGVPARPGVRRVLHRQRLHRLSARRAVRLPGRHPQPRGVDLQPARVHADRGAGPVAGLRPARVRETRDLHPHGGQPRGA